MVIRFVFLFFFCSLHAVELKGFLTKDEIALFYAQGYVLKPKALDPQDIEKLSESADAILARTFEEIGKSNAPIAEEEQSLYIDGARVVFKQRAEAPAIARINGCSGMAPSLLDCMRSEKMLHTFFELLGTADLEHIICQFHPKLPGDCIAFPRHRDIQFRKAFDPDWQDILGNGSYAICIIPIDPQNEENGGLWIETGENRIWIEAEPGDLLFMHPYLYHGSGPNQTSMSRRTLLTGFCAFGANHKAYPGADVNTRCMLQDGEIVKELAPWRSDLFIGSGKGH